MELIMYRLFCKPYKIELGTAFGGIEIITLQVGESDEEVDQDENEDKGE